MQLSDDGSILLKVTNNDIQNGVFTIPNSVTHIDERAFGYCSSLTQVTIPNSVTHIGERAFDYCKGLTQVTIPHSVTHIGERAFGCCRGLTQVTIPHSVTYIDTSAFLHCDNLNAIIIDVSNLQDQERISGLIPEGSRHLIMPHDFLCKIKKVKTQALELIQPIGRHSFPQMISEDLINLIQQFDERLHDVINQIPLPLQPEQLQAYKNTLHEELSQYRQEQEPQHQKLAAINKLQTIIQINEQTIAMAINKPGFFNSSINRLKLDETNTRIVVATKLIQWLGNDNTISFTEEEKALLTKEPKNSVALILHNHGIYLNELPQAPFPLNG